MENCITHTHIYIYIYIYIKLNKNFKKKKKSVKFNIVSNLGLMFLPLIVFLWD